MNDQHKKLISEIALLEKLVIRLKKVLIEEVIPLDKNSDGSANSKVLIKEINRKINTILDLRFKIFKLLKILRLRINYHKTHGWI